MRATLALVSFAAVALAQVSQSSDGQPQASSAASVTYVSFPAANAFDRKTNQDRRQTHSLHSSPRPTLWVLLLASLQSSHPNQLRSHLNQSSSPHLLALLLEL